MDVAILQCTRDLDDHPRPGLSRRGRGPGPRARHHPDMGAEGLAALHFLRHAGLDSFALPGVGNRGLAQRSIGRHGGWPWASDLF